LTTSEFPRIGNPNLNPEISVQYEVGGGHQFSSDMAVKISLFYKDIYDYPTSISYTLEQRNYLIYRNIDYARSRGVELELRKRRSVHASWSAAYSYSVAKGKSSDPNALALVRESGGDARQTALGEQFMWWNRPHKVTVWADYRINRGEKRPKVLGWKLPDEASVNLYYMLQSGMAYTPQDVNGVQTGQDFSKNGPLEQTLNGTLTKAFRLAGRKWEFTLQGWNLFNQRTLLDFDPSTGKAWTPGKGSLNAFNQNPANLNLSDAELINLSGQKPDPSDPTGAQLAKDIRAQIQSTVYRYQNPAYRAVPRNFRVGISMEW
jgi:outer membrane receptor protein involved in Fe transport